MGKRTDRTILSRVNPSFYDRLTKIVEAYREAGQAMSVSRLCELYILDAVLRDGYSDGRPCKTACSPEAAVKFFPYLEACPQAELVDRIRVRRATLLRAAAKVGTPTVRDPETVAAEVAVINAEP